MSRFLIIGCALGAAMSLSTEAVKAQSNQCGCCAGVSTYQRYSYQPAPMSTFSAPVVGAQAGSVVLPNQPGSAAAASQVPAGQAPMAGTQVQNYSRYSYQPVPAGASQPAQVSGTYYAPTYYGMGNSGYSYSGSSYSSGHRKSPWEYAKGDPRRYRP